MDKCRGVMLFTDFGPWDHYLGEMKAVIMTAMPLMPVQDLMPCAPHFNPRASAYLLCALLETLPKDMMIITVVDPGVGGVRQALMLTTERHWLLGPDNGLLALAARQPGAQVEVIDWAPSNLSRTFHGRDFFAPVAVHWLQAKEVQRHAIPTDQMVGADWPDEVCEVIHIDHYGNLITGMRLGPGIAGDLNCRGKRIPVVGAFCEVPEGTLFGYRNSAGLLEIAVNQGSAAQYLGVNIGEPVSWVAHS